MTTPETGTETGTENGIVERLTTLAAPALEAHGVELVDIEVKGYTGSRVVRLVVDRDGGIDISTCAALSRDVEGAFDEVDAVAGSYTLQVTSPGVDRPLRTARDFARNVGRTVTVLVRVRDEAAPAADDDAPPSREMTGVVADVSEDAVVLEPDEGDDVTIALQDVERGRVVLPW